MVSVTESKLSQREKKLSTVLSENTTWGSRQHYALLRSVHSSPILLVYGTIKEQVSHITASGEYFTYQSLDVGSRLVSYFAQVHGKLGYHLILTEDIIKRPRSKTCTNSFRLWIITHLNYYSTKCYLLISTIIIT